MATADLLPKRLEEAVTALNAGDLQRAMAAASAAMAIDPENADCHLVMAGVLHTKGSIREAEHHYIESLRINPKQPSAMVNLGKLKLNDGYADAAIVALKTALEIDKSSVDARHFLARAYGMKGDLESAVFEFKKVLKNAGRDVEIILGYAKALAGLERYDEALKALKRADRLMPGHLAIGAALAEVRAAMGQAEPS